ncbi:MAG TPA: RepB family plasmid replication initiator protein [Bacteroidetes bacterium]|nr:RepB family plasmid replication initiator protein [Bacteroidota bacterium]
MPTTKKTKTNIAQISNPFLESFVRNNDLVSFKVLLYIAKAKLDTVVEIGKLEDKQTYKVPLGMRDITCYLNLDIRTIRNAISRLNSTSINYRRTDGGKEKETFLNLLPAGEINYTDNTLDVWIFGEILKQIYATMRYSYVQTKNFIELTSKHSIRMLLLLERINNFGENIAKRKHYELDELNKLFGTRYVSYTLFEKKVLIPAKKDLDKHSSLSFVYIKNKDKILTKGRARITHITIDLVQNLKA